MSTAQSLQKNSAAPTKTIDVPCGVYYNGFKFYFILFGRKVIFTTHIFLPSGASTVQIHSTNKQS